MCDPLCHHISKKNLISKVVYIYFSHNWPKNNPFEVNENSHLLGNISIFIIKISWYLSFHWLEDFYCDELKHLITISSQSAYHCRWVLGHWSLSSSITSHSFTIAFSFPQPDPTWKPSKFAFVKSWPPLKQKNKKFTIH